MKWLMAIVFVPSLAFASEDCASQLKGKCRDACTSDQKAEQGAFVDCGETQKCCVPVQAAKNQTAAVASVVNLTEYAFVPAILKIKAGSEVIWKNKDGVEHTITANDGGFDSGSLASEGEFRKKFIKPGTYSYYCEMHPSMTGTIVVE
ncbi:MAG TPA: cupredoxin family copper-binding protein [Thermodesulfovibrionales bacterium]|nr:cupredoxin family copper-binding protein [Thermodesulfovibrionales bacterium]